jgi:hypothetical protein
MSLKTTLGAIFVILICQTSLAARVGDCKKLDSKSAFFDGKRKSWLAIEEIQLLDCDGSYQAALIQTQAKAELDRIGLPAPQKSEKWILDGLICTENNKSSKTKRHKLILTVVGQLLRPKVAYAVNEKTKKFEVVNVASLNCQ